MAALRAAVFLTWAGMVGSLWRWRHGALVPREV